MDTTVGTVSGPRPRSTGAPTASLPDELEALLTLLADADLIQARIVGLVAHLQATGEAEAATGVPLELWLSARGRRTRADRRMLGTAADTLQRLPSLAAAFVQGRVSWSQVRALALRCERLPAHVCDAVDDALARELDGYADAEPEALLQAVGRALASIDPTDTPRPSRDSARRFLHLQPTLDEGGGRVYGELDPVGFAVLAEATDPGPPARGTGRHHVGDTGSSDARREVARTQARRRADRLVDLLARSLGDGTPPSPAPSDASPPGTDAALPVAPRLLLTMSLDSLLGRDDTPAELLTSLTGGRLRVPADVARRIADTSGAAVRSIVLDDTGRVLGVGRRRRHAPGWIRDAVLARDAVCAEPVCRRSALTCDLDHVRPWAAGGRTDVDNLQPLCGPVNRRLKDAWDVEVSGDGSRRWTHQRSGLTLRTVPYARRLGVVAGTDPPTPDREARDPLPPHRVGPSTLGDRPARADPAHRDPPADPDLPF